MKAFKTLKNIYLTHKRSKVIGSDGEQVVIDSEWVEGNKDLNETIPAGALLRFSHMYKDCYNYICICINPQRPLDIITIHPEFNDEDLKRLLRDRLIEEIILSN